MEKQKENQIDLDEEVILGQIDAEVESVLQKGGLLAAVLGLLLGATVTVLSLSRIIEDVTLPGILAFAAGGISLLIYFLARKKLMKGLVVYAVFIPFVCLPTFLFLASWFFVEGGAAAYLTGPISNLYYFLIIMTGFLYNSKLARYAGYFAAGGYLFSYYLAVPELCKVTTGAELLRQDLTNPALYFFKTFMMIFSGYAVGALSENFKKLVFSIIKEVKQKETINKLFGEFVSHEIKEKIINEKSGKIAETKQVAILFADIRSFTAMSENKNPADIVIRLNEYFDRMVKAITDNGGVVDKFIGDSVMAVFGGVLELSNPSEAALKAAYAMEEKLKVLNEEWQKQKIAAFTAGIGIDFGEVLQGTIGSANRKEFTIIGDPVNTASRVEGLTKKYPAGIIVTQNVYDRLPEAMKQGLDHLGAESIKGREKTVDIYGVKK